MNVSSIGSSAAIQQAYAARAVTATSSRPQAPIDSDGDRDGSKAASGRLDVKA